MDNRSIGVFDSGLGGLSAVRELELLLPNENIVYFGDTGRVPYGTKSHETILHYASQDISFIRSHNVKMIIAACGTVSSSLPPSAFEECDIPFLGVVDSTASSAVRSTSNGTIAVIGTPLTIQSNAFKNAILSIDPSIRVVGTACPLFVPLVENGFIGKDCEITKLAIQHYLGPLMKEKPDTMILGCTHFPIILDLIDNELDHAVKLINPGYEVALYAKNLLTAKDLLSSSKNTGHTEFYVSDNNSNFSSVAEIFLGHPVQGVTHQIDIEAY